MQIDIDTSVLGHLKSLTLLCVEDNKTTQLIYKSIFKDLVKKIFFAYDGQEGYQYFIENNIDLIICDYDMPVLNGLDMINKIRKINKKIPIILVSAIEDIDVIVEALQLNVNNFLKKPIKTQDVIQAIDSVTKLLIADLYLKNKREKKIKDLQDKDDYNSYQEDLAFSKELNILRNDFYYQMIDKPYGAIIDFFYKPLDIVSGDAYSVRRINDHQAFYLVVDGMGKGLSASLSSMLMTSFINHTIDIMLKENRYDFYTIVESSIEYIKPILLSEEALAVDFININYDKSSMTYAKFAMPSTLVQTSNNDIIRLKSNNSPISKYIQNFTTSTYDISNIIKFLIYSDGIVENITTIDDKPYNDFIQKDFLDSFSREDMVSRFLDKTDIQEDDITFIFINLLHIHNDAIAKKTFQSSISDVDKANEWYEKIWSDLTSDMKLSYNATLVFTEMFMNAFEHGNLQIDASTKHRLIDENNYLNTLKAKQLNCNKKIYITVNKIEYNSEIYIITKIRDEGNGFDTKILEKIFQKTDSFNGRGVYISKQLSVGIYYNKKGNSVLFLHKL